MVVHTCDRCGKEFPKLAKLRIHLGRKNPCRPNVQELIPEPIPELTPEAQEFNEIELLKEQGSWEYAKRKEFKSYYKKPNEFYTKYEEPPLEDITNFEEVKYGNPERQHQNSLMSVWQVILPSEKNPKYNFNVPIDKNDYKNLPYMPQIISNLHEAMNRVYERELQKHDQIKSAITVYCTFKKIEEKDGKRIVEDFIHPYMRGDMHVILSEDDIENHINSSGCEIDKKIDEYLSKGSDWTLV